MTNITPAMFAELADEPRLVVNGTNFDVAKLHAAWSQPLETVYP